MCPLRPYLVLNSTGLNQRMSSASKEQPEVRGHGAGEEEPTSVEEQVPDDDRPLVDLEGVPTENYTLAHHSKRIHLIQ